MAHIRHELPAQMVQIVKAADILEVDRHTVRNQSGCREMPCPKLEASRNAVPHDVNKGRQIGCFLFSLTDAGKSFRLAEDCKNRLPCHRPAVPIRRRAVGNQKPALLHLRL